MKKILTLLTAAAAMAGCVKESGGDEHVIVGKRLPVLPEPGYLVEEAILDADPDNLRRFDTRDLEGRKTLIYFFWVACPECRETTPHVLDVWTQIRERDDIQLVCIARGGTLEQAGRQDAVAYWEELDAEIDPAPMPPLFYDEDRRVFDLFARQGVPRFYLAGADGVVRWKNLGIVSASELIRQIDNL